MREKIEELRRRLDRYNNQYYVENRPTVSDREYDALMRELEELERAHPEWDDPTSPTRRVGSDLTEEFRTVEHRYPMRSLANTYSLDELHDFLSRVEREVGEAEYVCELKFDGTAIALDYADGRLELAATRGDGRSGDDVTANVRTIRSVPLRLEEGDYPSQFEIRGEVLLPYASFDRLNGERASAGEPLFANPRNAAAGTLKQQASAVVARRGLDCILYELVGDDLPFATHWESLEAARRWGFKVSDKMELARTAEDVDRYIVRWDEGRHALPYATDGVVVKVNRYADRVRLGATAKAPRWAVAFKFKAEQASTRLIDVTFQVGRTGAVTPVANLDPVLLAGTTVRRASLHNAEQIAAMDVRIGDTVLVEKGGEIIPKIVGVDLTARPAWSEPLRFVDHCPECGTPLVRYEGEARHYCPNQSHCPPQIVGRIVHFIRRRALDIEGLGEETVELLYREGLIRDAADLYDLRADQLAPLPRLGVKSAENILSSLDRSRTVPFERVLFGLGIRFVGEATARSLAAQFGSLDAVMGASREELVAAEEVGEKIAESILDFFADADNRQVVERLRRAGLQFASTGRAPRSDRLAGLSILLSGRFERHSREQWKELIELHGGRPATAVSSQLDLLVAGEKMGPAKRQKAEKLGIRTITEEELARLVGEEVGYPGAAGVVAESVAAVPVPGTGSKPAAKNRPVDAADDSSAGHPLTDRYSVDEPRSDRSSAGHPPTDRPVDAADDPSAGEPPAAGCPAASQRSLF